MAPMILLPFVENTFKHGVSATQQSHVNILVLQRNTLLDITIKNSIIKDNSGSLDTDSGIGLVNTRRRLDLLYPGKYTLDIRKLIAENEYLVPLNPRPEMILNCIAVDDEPLALSLVSKFIEQTPFLNRAGRYAGAVDALIAIHTQNIDLIFLDIQMHHLNGIELARVLDKGAGKPRIIFTTAFNQLHWRVTKWMHWITC